MCQIKAITIISGLGKKSDLWVCWVGLTRREKTVCENGKYLDGCEAEDGQN